MPDLSGMQEAQFVDGCCYDRAARVSHRRNARTHVDQVHDSTPQDGAERVGVVRKGDVGVLRLRFSYRAANHWRIDSTGNCRKSDRCQTMTCPPLADIVEPVITPASSAARKTTQRAISSGSQSRPRGMYGRIFFSSTSFRIALTISVAV